jgi:hypothetical protein
MKQLSLKEMVLQRQQEEVDRVRFGRKLAVVLCEHGDRRYPVAQVRGSTLLGIGPLTLPHDLWRATHEVYLTCQHCKVRRLVDWPRLRSRMRGRRGGVLPLNVDDVSRRVARD